MVARWTDYRDADRIVTLLTPQQGRIDCLARGARRSRKRFGGALQPLAVVDALVAPPGRGQLHVLREVSLRRVHRGIEFDLVAFALASLAVELLLRSSAAHHADERAFEWLTSTLDALDSDAGSLDAVVGAAWIETCVLMLRGALPPPDRCARCGADLAETGQVHAVPAPLHCVCSACARREPGASPMPPLAALLEGGLDGRNRAVARAWRRLLDAAVSRLAGASLRSLGFLDGL